MAGAVDGATNNQGCGGCAGQQDRPDGLGIDDKRRALQRAGHRIERDKASDRRRGWKGRTGANAPSRLIPPNQENPLGPCTLSASFRSGPKPREWHYGQRHRTGRTHRSDTWPHQPATAKLREPLANGEPSIHGPISDIRSKQFSGAVSRLQPLSDGPTMCAARKARLTAPLKASACCRRLPIART